MKLSETQQRALDVVQELVREEKITLQQAFDLITAIYEKEKEYVYIPQYPYEPYRPWSIDPYYKEPQTSKSNPSIPNTLPYTTPIWWQNQITCDKQSDISTNESSINRHPGYETYLRGNTPGYFWNDWQGSITR